MKETCGKCPGYCCRCFPLPYSPEDIQSWVNRDEKTDHYKASQLLIYLGRFKTNPINPDSISLQPESCRDYSYFYTCRNLGLDGKCKDYENRMKMCSSYNVEYATDLLVCPFYPKYKKED